jgi:large subunit ribosomal protein L25
MARSETTTLSVQPREPDGSRSTRRLRRSGHVPGVVYGGTGEPVTFAADARELRLALAAGGAVIDLKVGDGKAEPVVVKDQQHHPVKGHTLHIDLLRVRLDVAIEATVVLELEGFEESPGATEGGVLEQITRELNVEALPTDIPDVITHDVAGAELNDTILLSAVKAPRGVTLLDDPDETVVGTVAIPKVVEEPEIETETELVGEDGEPIEAPEGEAAEGEGEAAAEGEGGGEASEE